MDEEATGQHPTCPCSLSEYVPSKEYWYIDTILSGYIILNTVIISHIFQRNL